MDSKKLLVDLREALSKTQNNNQQTVSIAALQTYLQNWERDSEAIAKDNEAQRNHNTEQWKAQLAVDSANNLEMFKAVIEAGQTALKSAIVINGGAAAAVLALLAEGLKAAGHLTPNASMSVVGFALLFFMLGLATAGLATAFRYLSQACYCQALMTTETTQVSFTSWGHRFRNCSIFCGVASYGLFISGAVQMFLISQHYLP